MLRSIIIAVVATGLLAAGALTALAANSHGNAVSDLARGTALTSEAKGDAVSALAGTKSSAKKAAGADADEANDEVDSADNDAHGDAVSAVAQSDVTAAHQTGKKKVNHGGAGPGQVTHGDVLEDGAQLVRYAGEGKQVSVVSKVEGQAWRHAGPVADESGGLRKCRHLPVARIELGSPAAGGHVRQEHQVLHLRSNLPPVGEPLVERSSQRDVRPVVRRWSKPAADEDARQLWTTDVIADGVNDVGIEITDGGHQANRESAGKQATGEPVGVGIHSEAAQNLVADDDDARLRHALHNDRNARIGLRAQQGRR